MKSLISFNLIPKKIGGFNTWDMIGDMNTVMPGWSHLFDAVAYPSYSLSQTIGFREIEDSFVFEIELPRFKKENIKITTENNNLHISAEQDSLKFYHQVSLPLNFDIQTIKAKLDLGVLTITAQKQESKSPIQIAVE